MKKITILSCFFFFVLSLGLSFNACSGSYGTQFDNTKISKIEKGKTTQLEILELLGEPTARGIDSDGKALWRYMYATTSLSKLLTLSFNKDNIVENYIYEESNY